MPEWRVRTFEYRTGFIRITGKCRVLYRPDTGEPEFMTISGPPHEINQFLRNHGYEGKPLTDEQLGYKPQVPKQHKSSE